MNEDQAPKQRVEVGQVWRWRGGAEATPPDVVARVAAGVVRIVCPYPFGTYEDELWVVETEGVIEGLWRIAERSLRAFYELDEKARPLQPSAHGDQESRK
jgi:hypothetical protein